MVWKNHFREMGEREGAVIPLNSLRGYTDPLAMVLLWYEEEIVEVHA
jgi:hypothetical protein